MAVIKTMHTQRSTEEQDMKQYEMMVKEERMYTFKRLAVGKPKFFFYSEDSQETAGAAGGVKVSKWEGVNRMRTQATADSLAPHYSATSLYHCLRPGEPGARTGEEVTTKIRGGKQFITIDHEYNSKVVFGEIQVGLPCQVEEIKEYLEKQSDHAQYAAVL